MRRLIGSTLFLLASAGWAAAALGPLEAAAILAEAKAANDKCQVLDAAEAENLGLFSARAEVAAVGAATPDKASPQLHEARQRGAVSACDAATKARVREIYEAASEAMAAVNSETAPPAAGPVNILPQPLSVATIQPAPRPAPPQAPQPQPRVHAPKPVVQAQPRVLVPAPVPQAPRYNFSAQQPQLPQPGPQYALAEPPLVPAPQPQYVYVEPEPVPQYVYAQPQYMPPQPQPILNERFLARFSVVLERPEPQPAVYQTPAAVYTPEPVYAPASDVTGGLDHYALRASAYYVERRCQHLNPQQAQQFWQSIAAQHATMLERESPSAIEAALAQSRARADQMACGGQSAQFVQQAFQGF